MQDSVETVTLVRTVNARPQRVYEAWIDPRQLEQWLTQTAEADARVGGCFRLQVKKENETHVVSGEYRELVPGRRIVKTWVYEGPYAPEGSMHARLTVELGENGANTEVSLRHEGLTSPRYRAAIQQGAWTKALDNLEALLTASVPPGEDSSLA